MSFLLSIIFIIIKQISFFSIDAIKIRNMTYISNPSENNQNTDYISNLHDSILSHILSFLPTKSAVKTSVLSKRWKNVWTQVSTLDFIEIPDYYHTSLPPLSDEAKINYNNFVSKVLVENNVSYLQRFCYEFSSDDDSDKYESWVNAAKTREYYELDLDFTLRQSHRFLDLICGNRLVILKLYGAQLDDGTPEYFHLPSLKVIHLTQVVFNGDEYIKKLILGCATLQELSIEECNGWDETLYVESLTLKSLKIHNTANQIKRAPSSISIKTPNLEYLSIEDAITHYMINSLDSLIEANLNLSDEYFLRSFCDNYQGIGHLLRKVSGVSTFRLIKTKSLYYEKELPTFKNLTHFEIMGDDYTYELLKQAPKLKSLIIKEIEWIDVDEFFDSLSEDSYTSSLEYVTVSLNYTCQLYLVKYILKVATALKKMTINMNACKVDEREILIELLKLPRSSPICNIEVVYP